VLILKYNFLTRDSVIDNAYGHIRRALDYLHDAMKQIEFSKKINNLISKISDLFN